MNQKLYIVFGTGADSVGLVEKITTPIAAVNGNIIDLRQDVLHGLFTVFMVVDLAGSSVAMDGLQGLVETISDETSLDLSVDKYQPVARSAEKENMLMILLGRDKPGIIATVTQILKTYNINIEFSEVIARESIFLMELLVDIHHCAIPLENLQGKLRDKMGTLGISTMFQTEDVFNKNKRILLFDIQSSFIDGDTLLEILQLTGIPAGEFNAALGQGDAGSVLNKAAGYLEDLPLEVAANVTEAIQVTPGTVELLQTLKIMGYKIALMSRGFTCVSEILKSKLGIDYCFGVPLVENDDAMTVTGELEDSALQNLERGTIIADLASREGVLPDDITVISDDPDSGESPPGLRLHFDMKVLLDYYNQHILSRESLIGLLASFGIPAAMSPEARG